jgi:chromosome segregation ATPase
VTDSTWFKILTYLMTFAFTFCTTYFSLYSQLNSIRDQLALSQQNLATLQTSLSFASGVLTSLNSQVQTLATQSTTVNNTIFDMQFKLTALDQYSSLLSTRQMQLNVSVAKEFELLSSLSNSLNNTVHLIDVVFPAFNETLNLVQQESQEALARMEILNLTFISVSEFVRQETVLLRNQILFVNQSVMQAQERLARLNVSVLETQIDQASHKLDELSSSLIDVAASLSNITTTQTALIKSYNSFLALNQSIETSVLNSQQQALQLIASGATSSLVQFNRTVASSVQGICLFRSLPNFRLLSMT